MTEIVTADIGGTNARFAIAEVDGGKVRSLGEPVKVATRDHASLRTAWQAFGRAAGRDLPQAAAIAIAAPIAGEVIRMTNSPWTLRPARLFEELGLERHVLLNDFAAVAHAVAAVEEEHFSHVTGPRRPLADEGVVSIVGPGTGLGVAALLKTGGHTHVLATEGGHADFAPLDPVEDRLLAKLRERHRRVSVERIVSGPGLRIIFEVLAEIEGRQVPAGDDKALWKMALESEDSLSAAALDRFCLCLGAAAGDIALCHGPGPVVIAGGVGQRLTRYLPQSGFPSRFSAKGRYQSLMESLPVKLITHPEPGLYGAAAAFAKEHGR